MSIRRSRRFLVLCLVPGLWLFGDAPAAYGQQQGGGQNQQNQQGGSTAAGIKIDAQGVVTPVFTPDSSKKLNQKRLEAAAARSLPADLNTPSPMRKVSLVKLEAACADAVRNGEPVPTEMMYLAGIQRIDYVFVYPDQEDLVIAGPAEGFAPDEVGRIIGVTTGRPPLRMDDLMIALRAAERGGEIGCSIDPAPERLAALKQYLALNSTPATPAIVQQRYHKMADVLGLQDVKTWGVPAESHFAHTLVEADYRMKLVSMGLQKVHVAGFRTHLSMLTPTGNSMQRWWLTPLYDAFYRSEDGNAFQLAGQRAQLLAQEEVVGAAGQRSDAAFTRLTTQTYAQLFTEKFPELADEVTVFAELQNLIDLAVVAALFKKERLPEKVNWPMDVFLDAERVPIVTGAVPRHVPTIFSFRRASRRLVLGLIGGGVTIDPMQTVRHVAFKSGSGKRLDGIRVSARSPSPTHKQGRWWWD